MHNDPIFPTTIVGVDGASGGRDAFALACRLAPDAERLIVLSIDLSNPLGDAMAGGANRVDAERQAAEFSALSDASGPEVLVRVITAGTVADGIAEEAQRRDADLVVVGSSQRGTAMRVLLGDDTRDVLHRAPCAVAVAPLGYAEQAPAGLSAIGVGYGNDPASERAVELAQHLKTADGSLRLTRTVLPSPVSIKLLPAGITAEQSGQLAALDGFDERNVTFGSVRHGLLELANRVDLLVIGLHHQSTLGRLLHGSTADELLHQLPCPLLAVPELPLHAAAPSST